MMKPYVHSERIKHHLAEAPCDCCGAAVHVGDISYYTLAGECGLYCSPVCADMAEADLDDGEQALQARSDLFCRPIKTQQAFFAGVS